MEGTNNPPIPHHSSFLLTPTQPLLLPTVGRLGGSCGLWWVCTVVSSTRPSLLLSLPSSTTSLSLPFTSLPTLPPDGRSFVGRLWWEGGRKEEGRIGGWRWGDYDPHPSLTHSLVVPPHSLPHSTSQIISFLCLWRWEWMEGWV